MGAARTCPGLPWSVLAGIGKVESDHGQSTAPGIRSGANFAGAEGPMQFEPATFARYATARLSRSTKPVSALTDPAVMRAVLDAAATRLNGQPAAPWTARTNRAILANAIEYAIELRILSSNPIKPLKWKAPKATQEVDRRSVVNPAQARRLLDAVRKQMPSGPRLVAFFAVIYYAALRPEEAVNLHRDNITLPPLVRNAATGEWEEPADNWGEMQFCSAAPEVGAEWTDDGTRREQRHLKSRPVGEWRRVPVARLRAPSSRLFRLGRQSAAVEPCCPPESGQLA
jgi:integrase